MSSKINKAIEEITQDLLALPIEELRELILSYDQGGWHDILKNSGYFENRDLEFSETEEDVAGYDQEPFITSQDVTHVEINIKALFQNLTSEQDSLVDDKYGIAA